MLPGMSIVYATLSQGLRRSRLIRGAPKQLQCGMTKLSESVNIVLPERCHHTCISLLLALADYWLLVLAYTKHPRDLQSGGDKPYR